MNKNMNIDDERMASDTDIDNMNREYNMTNVRERIVKTALVMKNINGQKHHICTLDFDNIARCYFLEQDILLSLNFLYMKSRQMSTRNTIKNIIKIKERCASDLLSLYIKGTGRTLTYAPNIVDRMNYVMLWNEINYMQCTLLSRLSDIVGIYRIMCMEHTATLMLHSIKP